MKIMKLLELSVEQAAKGSTMSFENNKQIELKVIFTEALNKAKEAFSLDRTLHRFRDQNGETMFHNFDLTYSVFFNLAEQYENNNMYVEALNTYNIMTKNKMFAYVNQLKLNMGNIYCKMGIYSKAVKMYRMALDSVSNNFKYLRLKITQNIGIIFSRLGQYSEAAASFEFIMSEISNMHTGVNLLLCYYALGDVEKIKSTFRNLCDTTLVINNEFDTENTLLKLQQIVNEKFSEGDKIILQKQLEITNNVVGEFKDTAASRDKLSLDRNQYIVNAIVNDELATYVNRCKNNEKHSIVVLVDLISPIVEDNYNDGYNWCIEIIKTSNLSWLGNELELNKALVYLRQNDINQAIDTLQYYDRKSDTMLTSTALINLSFIYINLGNMDMALHCIQRIQDLGVMESNPMVLTNASILDINKSNYKDAYTKLQMALTLNKNLFEANYDMGLVGLRINDATLAQEQFESLKVNISATHHHVYYSLAKLHELNDQVRCLSKEHFNKYVSTTVLEAFLQVLGLSASQIDAYLFEKVGLMYEQLNINQKANQYHDEAFRINPSDIDIATSIGSYYVKLQAVEKALTYFERAVLAAPKNPNSMLSAASCYKSSSMPPKQYLEIFKKIYSLFPENIGCVGALMQITKSLNLMPLHQRYALELSNLQKLADDQKKERRQHNKNSNSHLNASKYFNQSKPDNDLLMGNASDAHDVGGNIIFQDPLGPPPSRPRTGKNFNVSTDSDNDDVNSDVLLPF